MAGKKLAPEIALRRRRDDAETAIFKMQAAVSRLVQSACAEAEMRGKRGTVTDSVRNRNANAKIALNVAVNRLIDRVRAI